MLCQESQQPGQSTRALYDIRKGQCPELRDTFLTVQPATEANWLSSFVRCSMTHIDRYNIKKKIPLHKEVYKKVYVSEQFIWGLFWRPDGKMRHILGIINNSITISSSSSLLCCCKLFTPSDTSSGCMAPDWPGRAEGAWPCCRWSCTRNAGAYTSRWGCRPWPHPDRGCRVSPPRSRGSPSTGTSLREGGREVNLSNLVFGGRVRVSRRLCVSIVTSWAFAAHFIQRRPKRTAR